jgi:hypothetical protein
MRRPNPGVDVAGVVDQHVDASEPSDRSLHGRIGVGGSATSSLTAKTTAISMVSAPSIRDDEHYWCRKCAGVSGQACRVSQRESNPAE